MTDNRTIEPTTTERLRALLDERGVEWKSGRTNENNTSWDVGDLRVTAKELSDGTLLIQQYSRRHFTPEQAIATTLGNGTLTAEQVRETIVKHGKPRFYGDWQAIADELNIKMGSEKTCKFIPYKDNGGFGICSACHESMLQGNFCPNCGRKVVKK